jgi:hypothetical protein
MSALLPLCGKVGPRVEKWAKPDQRVEMGNIIIRSHSLSFRLVAESTIINQWIRILSGRLKPVVSRRQSVLSRLYLSYPLDHESHQQHDAGGTVGADDPEPSPAARKKLKAATTSDNMEQRPTSPPLWKSLTKSRDGQSLTIDEPNEDVQEALRNIGDEDPAVLLEWEIAALKNAVAHVNTMAVGVQPAVPAWITAGGYPITTAGLQRDIAVYITQPGSGLHGNTLVAPNTLDEFGNVWVKIGALIMHPFLVALCTLPN